MEVVRHSGSNQGWIWVQATIRTPQVLALLISAQGSTSLIPEMENLKSESLSDLSRCRASALVPVSLAPKPEVFLPHRRDSDCIQAAGEGDGRK